MVNLNRLHSSLAKLVEEAPVSINIQSHIELMPGLHSIIAAINDPEATFETLAQSFAHLTEGHGKIVAGSVREIDHPSAMLVRFIAAQNTISKPYTEENVKGFKALAANVMAADDGSIWKVVGEGEARRLVQTSHDDLGDLLNERRSRMVVTANFEHGFRFNNGEFVQYLHPETAEISFGYGLVVEGQPIVFDRKTEQEVKVTSELMIDSAITAGSEAQLIDGREVNANLNRTRANEVLEYARKLYGKHPEFMNKLESILNGMAGKFNSVFGPRPSIDQHIKESMNI